MVERGEGRGGALGAEEGGEPGGGGDDGFVGEEEGGDLRGEGGFHCGGLGGGDGFGDEVVDGGALWEVLWGS